MADPTDLLSTLGLTPGVALGGLGLGYEALRGNQMPKGYQPLSQAAGTLGQEGQQMMSAGLGGPLPPGAQALVNQQQNAGMANVRSTYDKLGLSGSTMEAQAQQSVNEQTMGTAFKISQDMMTQGMKATGLSEAMYSEIMQANVAQDTAFAKAIGNFAAALAGASA